MNIRRIIFYGLLLTFTLIDGTAFGQTKKEPKWDNTLNKSWPSGFQVVRIQSSADGTMQPAVFHSATGSEKKPLIVSLHTWSGDYTQNDPLAAHVLNRNWNYIHPNFRGPNNHPQACGSPLVISDLEDAIDYAVQHGQVDTSEIHIIGVSGGGYATLLAFMEIHRKVKSFSAWVPISNVASWYRESVARKNKYAVDILACTSSKDSSLNVQEAKKRSPIFMKYPNKEREGSQLFIYTGANDGYLGSVPITQSILFYNKLVKERSRHPEKYLVPCKDIVTLLAERSFPKPAIPPTIGDRKIYYHKSYKNIHLTVFEGRHEMLDKVALDYVPVGK